MEISIEYQRLICMCFITHPTVFRILTSRPNGYTIIMVADKMLYLNLCRNVASVDGRRLSSKQERKHGCREDKCGHAFVLRKARNHDKYKCKRTCSMQLDLLFNTFRNRCYLLF